MTVRAVLRYVRYVMHRHPSAETHRHGPVPEP